MAEIKNIPEVIYLQVDPDEWIVGEPIPLVDFRELAEVTWCEDNIYNTDIEYLRATPEREAAHDGYEVCKELYQAMLDYQWNAEGDAPPKHVRMMRKAKEYIAQVDKET